MKRIRTALLLGGSVAGFMLAAAGEFGAASAFELSGPVTAQNVSVYFVREAPGAAAPIDSLDTAIKDGRAVVREQPSGYAVDNLSDTPILASFGSLLRGGSQDQVVASSQIIAPHSTGTPIDTYCVDPFRSSQRGDESASTMTGDGLQTPSIGQKLSMLVGDGRNSAAVRLRQAGVWWGIDTLRRQLAEKTGAPLAPPAAEFWRPSTDPTPATLLRDRAGLWTDGLTLALDDPRLAAATAPIVADLRAPVALGDDVVGAAFAVNGRWVGAETYQSHSLFMQMWPALLRGYALESLAERGVATPAPTAAAMKFILENAGAGATTPEHDVDMQILDGRSSVVASVADAQGRVVAKTFVPKPDPRTDALTPEGVYIDALETGVMAGRGVDTLIAAPILSRDAQSGLWKVAEFPQDADALGLADIASLAAWTVFLGWLCLIYFRAMRRALASRRPAWRRWRRAAAARIGLAARAVGARLAILPHNAGLGKV